jgi:hypothetical protein
VDAQDTFALLQALVNPTQSRCPAARRRREEEDWEDNGEMRAAETWGMTRCQACQERLLAKSGELPLAFFGRKGWRGAASGADEAFACDALCHVTTSTLYYTEAA